MLAIVAVPVVALTIGAGGTYQALTQYRASLERYITMRDAVVETLPERRMCAGPEQLEVERDSLASELRRGRANARQGDIFTPAVAELLRLRLRAAAGEEELLPEDVFVPDENRRQPRILEVNDAFPWQIGAPRFHTLFLSLPGLPVELEYRLHGTDLVLLDVEANLVVDILRDALR